MLAKIFSVSLLVASIGLLVGLFKRRDKMDI
jgi:hypothetical protein